MKQKINKLIQLGKTNSKVIENYLFMTLLSVLNSFFSLFIYPYLIRTLGAEQYGRYVYALSIVSYFINFISFGFDLLAVKKITDDINSIDKKSEIISMVFTAKFYLFLLSSVIYGSILLLIPSFRENYTLYICLFFNTLTGILFPSWYFQAVQKMKWVTFIQLFCKLLSLPFIFLFVKEPNDLITFAIISTSTSVLGGVLAIIILFIYEKLKIRIIKFSKVKLWYKEAFPLFLNNFITIIKEQGAVLIIGNFFGMKEVAIYDLANKVITVPRLLSISINMAIFPKLSQDLRIERIKKVIKYEYIVSVIMMFIVIVLGYWAVLFLGGQKMIEAYGLIIVISPTIVAWLVVGAYIYFLFLPRELNYLITYNQIAAVSSFFIFSFIGIMLSDKIITLCIAMTLSGILEIFYCKYLIKKHKLLV